MRFTKMHGCGNDYVYLDAWREALPADLPALARAVSDRHRGIGSDGLIVVAPSQKADARMIMFNADGSESEMCGNGIRCCARLAWEHGHLTKRDVVFETGAGLLDVSVLLDAGGTCTGARVRMGAPRLTPATVPVEHPGPGPLMPVDLDLGPQGRWNLIAAGMGNPHAVCFVPDAETAPVTSVGPLIERHPRFPRRTNVEFVHRLPDEGGRPVLRQRTWERGAGETEACGTGACAVAVAAILTGRVPAGEVVLRLTGGDLAITWDGKLDSPVWMAGPAERVFEGEWPG